MSQQNYLHSSWRNLGRELPVSGGLSSQAHGEFLWRVPKTVPCPEGHRFWDLHLHSRCSDGRDCPRSIAACARSRNMGIAITDHNEIRGAVELYEQDRSAVILGIEVATRQGLDILVYFDTPDSLEGYYRDVVEPSKGIDPGSFTTLDICDVLRTAREHSGYSVLAHPFGLGWKNWHKELSRRGDEVLSLAFGIEVGNSALSFSRNAAAYQLARDTGLAITGGSDSHHIGTLGQSVTVLPQRWDSVASALCDASVITSRYAPLKGCLGHCIMLANHARYWPRITGTYLRKRICRTKKTT